MDPGHYGLQQGWDNDSALEGYGTAHEPDFRVGGTFNERRFLDERYSKEDFYPREAFHHENLNRENYAPPTSTSGLWPQSRKRSYKEEYAINRESRTHDSYHDLDAFNDHDIDAFQEFDRFHEDCSDLDNFSDHRYERPSRLRSRDRDEYTYDDYEYRSGIVHHKREIGRERDYEYGRHSYDSDYERGSREGNWRRHESRDRERDNKCSSREREQSPHRRYERSRSRGRDDHPRSRSPRGSSHGRNHREHSCDGRHERRRDQDEKRERLNYSMAPSATVVVKGLSHKTTEDDLYQILAEWGPLRHIRVIKERSSGISRGFAFIDFPSVGAAQAMMDKIEDVGLFVDERKLFFEYSSKPTGVGGGTFGIENFGRSGHYNNRSITMPSDWMCTICGCVNFARRTSCFQATPDIVCAIFLAEFMGAILETSLWVKGKKDN